MTVLRSMNDIGSIVSKESFFFVPAVSSGTSFVLAAILTVLLFSGMQMYRQWLASSQLHTILGGYLGSVLFILILTVSLYNIPFDTATISSSYINPSGFRLQSMQLCCIR